MNSTCLRGLIGKLSARQRADAVCFAYFAFIGLALVILAATLGGCELLQSKTPSPIDGKPATGAEIAQQYSRAEAEKNAAEAMAKAKAEAQQRAAEQAAKAALAALTAKQEISTAQAKLEAAEIVSNLDAKLASAAADYAQGRELRELTQRAIDERTQAAVADLKQKDATTAGFLGAVRNIPVVGQLISQSGAGGAIDTVLASLATGGGGVALTAFLANRSRKREDKAWDEATAKAEADKAAALATAAQHNAIMAAQQQASQQTLLMALMLKKYDRNKDGVLDDAELAAAGTGEAANAAKAA